MSVVGIIGGSGLYELDGLTEQAWQRIDSSFGSPSDELLFGRLGEQRIVFLPRHGRGHRLVVLPHGVVLSFLSLRANAAECLRAG